MKVSIYATKSISCSKIMNKKYFFCTLANGSMLPWSLMLLTYPLISLLARCMSTANQHTCASREDKQREYGYEPGCWRRLRARQWIWITAGTRHTRHALYLCVYQTYRWSAIRSANGEHTCYRICLE